MLAVEEICVHICTIPYIGVMQKPITALQRSLIMILTLRNPEHFDQGCSSLLRVCDIEKKLISICCTRIVLNSSLNVLCHDLLS